VLGERRDGDFPIFSESLHLLRVIRGSLKNTGLIIEGFNHWGNFVALSLYNSDKIWNSALGIDPRVGLEGRT
jgi:hypothetical protein